MALQTINNSLNQVFSSKKKNLLSIYFTAGFPELNSTNLIIKELSKAGVDFIEVGSPYNDPIADGLIIQDSANQALNNGMSVNKLFSQLLELKEETKNSKEKNAPIIWMGYFNLLLHYGVESFCKKANQVGISGLIVPDLPVEYFNQYQAIFNRYQLNFIFMVSPSSSKERILEMDKKNNVFLYVTSAQSTTGQDSQINQDFLKRLQSYNIKNPMVIGFNIKDKKSFKTACNYARGAIIGSAFIRYLKSSNQQNPNSIANSINKFIQSIKGVN